MKWGRARRRLGQYRETIPHQFFHSLNGQHASWKRPASHAFSSMNTTRVSTLSTSVEGSGEEWKSPANHVFWRLWGARAEPLNPPSDAAMLAPFRQREEERPTGVEGQQLLTAEGLWTEVSERLRAALNDKTYRTWFSEAEGLDPRTSPSRSRSRTTSRASGSKATSSVSSTPPCATRPGGAPHRPLGPTHRERTGRAPSPRWRSPSNPASKG